MENAPLNPADADSEKKSDGKKKKKNAEALGLFAVDPGSAKPKTETENIWDKLTFTKRKGGETQETLPLSQILKEAEARRSLEADETATEAESLSEPEERFVERAVVEARQQVDPLPGPEETDDAEAAAAEAVELFRQKVVSGGEPVEQAFDETLQSLAAEAPAEPQSSETSKQYVSPSQSGRSSGPTTNQAEHASAQESAPARHEATLPAETPVLNQTADRVPESDPALEQEAISPAERTPSVEDASGPPPQLPRSVAANYFPPSPEAQPIQPSRTKREFVPYYNNEDLVGAAFLGGIVGYLIGRRRGRIKTERKLKPIQKKLEKQVKRLERNIAFKEAHIRKVARQQTEERQQLQRVERVVRHDQHRIEALEANQLHGKKVSPERIGRVVVTAEERPRPEKTKVEKKEKARSAGSQPIDKRIETMSRAELLDLSQKVPVENTTLRQIYETHLIGEQGLRRLVNEHVHGGDIQKVLREELVEHEMDFERDPMLRDRPRDAISGGASANESLQQLLRKANVLTEAEAKEELAVLKARQVYHQEQHVRQQKRRRALDVSMATTIAVLLALVIILLIRNG